ncbi:integrase catalytic domain-containing protein [Trichonephila clavipes]|nr:integrase catalytic domain-containing protein [Trichonephila clavipes]
MSQGEFQLKYWEYTGIKTGHGWETPVQGLKWNRELDSLGVTMSWMNNFGLEKLLKRVMQSAVHKDFDPIGFNAPVMLCLDLILQKSVENIHRMGCRSYGNSKREILAIVPKSKDS